MKFLPPMVLLAACSALAMALFAAEYPPQPPPLTGCTAKRQDIIIQLDQAKTSGNKEQQSELENALSKATTNCTDASLLKQLEQKVLDAKHEVSRRQSDLNKAMSKGDADKINKRKDKLAESRKELQNAQLELERIEPSDD
ncbi:DUF1090 domain-containing protein [Pseudomonas sp. 10B1]|uniref:DUF1090 domain-containing protein n=1 Tax=unclassified Pseudomonas TaxID=196821 RepID=UPI002AB47B5A|nr:MULTISPECIES: DUF1090 domain-containing protein [unclassified Pseudomonas]MDY7562846.1 DUF1090 domain-containing protein [Pseudomonas sp. AB6]MEA9978714.1 DUF1090 domain-containing protein [Pseudomonas sp. RTS4]MEA9994355.1 DUF1090 domain-containing protein [Pseudomonas sp. AA4]MEB0088771.1 DUF1090 domain-containing protein [Pseudomonas sp. RTI1]MEB0126609.1 DUF1090 domain-containing protein [Pseudomonas sp. CCC1.2]